MIEFSRIESEIDKNRKEEKTYHQKTLPFFLFVLNWKQKNNNRYLDSNHNHHQSRNSEEYL